MIVVDASVVAKLILDEPDRHLAQDLISHALHAEIDLRAPSLLLYEFLSIALRHSVPFDVIVDFLDRLRKGGLQLREPTRDELLKAEEISTHGTRQAGYPEFADSIYHAMAVVGGGVLITADHRHAAKTTKQFGHVVLLADWRPDRISE